MRIPKRMVVAFVITLLLGLCGLGLLLRYAPALPVEEEVSSLPVESRTPFANESPVGVLLFLCKDRAAPPTEVWQLTFTDQPASCKMTKLSLSSYLPCPDGFRTIADCYVWGGMEKTAEAIREWLQTEPQYYLRVDENTMAGCLQTFGAKDLPAMVQKLLRQESAFWLDDGYRWLSEQDTNLTRADFYRQNRRIVAFLNSDPTLFVEDQTSR